jgi:hypothetical protein
MDLFIVPTIGFDLLYAFVIVRIDRRDLVWINVTKNPTAEWVARQITEAFPWDGAPGYMIRDRDRIYGGIVTRRLRAMGIRDKPTACGRKPHQPYRGKPPLPSAQSQRVAPRRRLNDRDHHRSLQPLTNRAPSAGPAWRIAARCSRDCAILDIYLMLRARSSIVSVPFP